jgi:glutathione synthase/RimK-type ligase-like ATP-grasp enzyme
MNNMTVLGIYREQIFSPGKVRDDAAILDAALIELSRLGYEILALQSEALDTISIRPACTLTMAKSDWALQILEEWQRSGTRVINSTRSIRNCYRKLLIHLLEEGHFPLPLSQFLPLENVEQEISFKSHAEYWLKRSDIHAIEQADVAKVTSKEELMIALRHFRQRKIDEVLVQEHLEGEAIKFYGVAGGQYFSAFLSSNGDEVTSEMKQLSTIAQQSAEGAGLEIYGGDAIMTRQGGVVLIDLNDWPSFSRCCGPAAKGIAKYITGVLEGGLHGSSSPC